MIFIAAINDDLPSMRSILTTSLGSWSEMEIQQKNVPKSLDNLKFAKTLKQLNARFECILEYDLVSSGFRLFEFKSNKFSIKTIPFNHRNEWVTFPILWMMIVSCVRNILFLNSASLAMSLVIKCRTIHLACCFQMD